MERAAPAKTIPGPRGRFLVGNTWDYERDRDAFLRESALRYGDVFRFGRNIVVVSDPELIHRILADTNTDYVLTTTPDQDRDSAAHHTATWVRGKHNSRGLGQGLRIAHARRLDTALEQRFADLSGTEFPLLHTAQELCGQVSGDFCLQTEADDIGRSTALFNRLALADMAGAASRHRSLRGRARSDLARAEHDCLDKLTRQVQLRLAEQYTGAPRDLLEAMVMPRDSTPADPHHIARMLKTILAAARGIPGAAFAWILWELSRNTTMREEIRAESTALDDAVTAGDVNRLPYTHAVVQEALRSHPATWLLGRVVDRPTQVGPWPVQSGEYVVFSPYHVHHDRRWWQHDPADFRPERWLTGQRPHAPRIPALRRRPPDVPRRTPRSAATDPRHLPARP